MLPYGPAYYLWQVRGALLHVCGVYFFRHGHLFSASAAPTPPADADANGDADMSAAPALLPPTPHEPTAGGGKAPPAQHYVKNKAYMAGQRGPSG